MDRRSFLLPLPAWLLSACGPSAPPPPAAKAVTAINLLESPHAGSWRQAGIPDEGPVAVKDGVLTLAEGQPMTGAVFAAWDSLGLPASGYSIHYEAMRVEGEDFFGTVTFPVSGRNSHASFVLGGWGGTVTGISSIDFSDANENQTRSEQRFTNGRWYRLRLEVRPEELRAWVDDRLVVNVSIKGRTVGLRPGFIDHCRPFGFASYGSAARIRGLVVQGL
ncbi:MAG: hypothetical protein U0984_09975 [Prosthecobacter sp.]|nr:hypothetical protein [Prosthecobacter sp.]